MGIFNFTANCSQTAILYNALHSRAGNLQALLRPLLASDTNLADAYLQTQLNNQTFVKMLLSNAGSECQNNICSSLNFTGNADIAGIGAIVAYGLIVLTTTLLLIEGVATAGNDDHTLWLENSDVLLAHFNSLLFFQVMVQIAFWAYLPKMKSIYELTIALLLTRMTACATIVMVAATSYSPLTRTQWCIWFGGLTASLATGIFSFVGAWYAKRVSTTMYLLVAMALMVLSAVQTSDTLEQKWHRIGKVVLGSMNVEEILVIGLFVGEALVMWLTFALIISVRQRAKQLFGPSYQDDALGYGQILAAGFSMQTIVDGARSVIRKSRSRSPTNLQTPAGSTTNLTIPSTEGPDSNTDLPLSPQRSRTSYMEDGISPTASRTSIPLHSLHEQAQPSSTSREIKPVTALQKRPTFS